MFAYKDLLVWQRSMELAEAVYQTTNDFPNTERYSLTSQIRRSAISVPSNIAEGKMRQARKPFRQFLLVAYGSAGELATQLELAYRIGYIEDMQYKDLSSKILEIMKMLNGLLSRLSSPQKLSAEY